MTLIDLHTHSLKGSSDSSISPDDLIAQAARVGLDGVCITEHGNRRLPREFVEDLGRRHGFLVIAGMEASTDQGHILVYGVDHYPEGLFHLRDIQAYVEERGGVLVVAHPFRYLPQPWMAPPLARRTLRQVVVREVFSLVRAVETHNGYAVGEEITFSRQVASALRLPGTGGSDAHTTHEVGGCATVFEDTVRDEADFLEALRSGRYRGEDRRALIAQNLLALARPASR